jgi:5'-3' exonuclease
MVCNVSNISAEKATQLLQEHGSVRAVLDHLSHE